MPASRQITYGGITDNISGWAVRFGLTKQRIHARLKRYNFNVNHAFATCGDFLLFRHGTVEMYGFGCRCKECTMPRGRPRKSIEEKRLAGTLEKRDMVQPAPVIGQEILANAPMPPPHLSPIGKQAWIHICNELAKAGVLTTSDNMIVEMLCTTYSRLREAQSIVDRDGLVIVIENKMGRRETVRPEVKIVEECTKTVANLLSRLGMTPVDRSRVTTGGAEEETNEFEDL